MNKDEAKEIFLKSLPKISEPLKSAVEFTLSNWHKLNREPRPSDVAIKFFASLPALPTNIIDLKLVVKPNAMAKLLRNAPDVWYSFDDLPHEEWRDVAGYEELYQVSNYGRVKSFQHNYPRIIRADEQSKGYLQIRLHRNRNSKNFGVHILVARAFIANPEEKPEVDHRNDYAKLTAEEVIYIRENPACLKSSQLAEKFNVSRATINRITAGVTYKDIM